MLETVYKDDKFKGLRKYRLIQNDDGTYSFEDVTEYQEQGTQVGASDLNEINDILKKLITSYGYRMLRIGSNFNLISNTTSDVKTIPFKQDLPNCNLEEDFVEVLSQGTLRAKKNGHIDITMDIINFATSTSRADGLISFVLYKNKVIQGATKFYKPIKYEGGYSYGSCSFKFATTVKSGDLIEIVAHAESNANLINTNFHSNSTIALKFKKI